MADIDIHRTHQLGLAKAREVAAEWAQEASERFDMVCENTQGRSSDTLHFERSGVKGQLIVAADHFNLQAKLGFLLGAFAGTIQEQIEEQLDGLLAREAAAAKPRPTRTASGSKKKTLT